ncbi:hypothetical protein WN943_007083 [Citrus x changshan-huyou]
MDSRDELTKSPLLSMKNLKDDELEHEYEQPLLCLKLYLDKSESNVLIEIAYSPPSKQSRYCGLSYIFLHGWQAFCFLSYLLGPLSGASILDHKLCVM